MEVVPEVSPGEGAHSRGRIRGISHDRSRHLLHELGFELLANIVNDDEPFGGDAALPGVEEPAGGACRHGGLQVPSNPLVLWLPSQKGFRLDAPQRQKAYGFPVGIVSAFPS